MLCLAEIYKKTSLTQCHCASGVFLQGRYEWAIPRELLLLEYSEQFAIHLVDIFICKFIPIASARQRFFLSFFLTIVNILRRSNYPSPYCINTNRLFCLYILIIYSCLYPSSIVHISLLFFLSLVRPYILLFQPVYFSFLARISFSSSPYILVVMSICLSSLS